MERTFRRSVIRRSDSYSDQFRSGFHLNILFPSDEPPGPYWYRPHVHGIAEVAVQGRASGAIVVEGIENIQTSVSGSPEQVLIVRDQILQAV
jgi:hypothetical protein